MYSRSFLRTILPVLGLVTALTSAGNAVVSNRIVSAITESRATLQNTVSPRAKSAIDLGSAPASTKLEGLTVRFNMTDAQQAALSQLLIDQQNPSSPRYHQWLTPQQFGAQFGLSADDISKVSSWLTAQGFTVTGVANSSTFITFSGTAAQVQQAFGTAIHSLSENGQKHIANLTEPTLPAAIASVVSNISGLNDFRPRPHLRTHQAPMSAIHPQNTVTTSSGTQHFIAPGDFYTIYDLNPLLSNSVNGTGITIAIMGQVDLNQSALNDVTAFRTAGNLLPLSNLPTSTLVGTDPGSPTQACLSNPTNNCVPNLGDLQESLLDVEWAGATAPGAKILFVTSTNVIDTSLVQAIDKNLAPIISVSYGACENSFSASDFNSLNLKFEQANAQGITIFAPAGDDGATDCDTGVSSATQGLTVDFPGSSPYVTALGGTMFNEGTGTYWNSTNGANGGSATTYIPETVWNETSADITGNSPSFGAGGGGASAYFAKPTWQSGTGVPNDFSRDVPDISFNAASNHDGYLVCVLSSCVNGNFYDSSGNGNVFGGTSVATPSFAGVIALVEQSLGGKPLGNINPNIYALANSTQYNNIFHDITTGNNDSPCTLGTTNCPNGGSIGYTAGTGYDQASGWGSIDAFNFSNEWLSFLPTPAFIGGQAVSQTTVTATPTSVTAGTAISLAITVASGSTSTNAPTGTVQVLVDGTAVTSSTTAPTLSSGSATYSLNTTSLTSGSHVVTAVYSGDTNFNTSKGTVSIDVTSASAPDFTLTPATASITVASGANSSGTIFTITPKNGFVGTVAFTSTGGINATYNVSPSTVTITSSTTSITATYTIQAFVANSNLRTGQIRLKLASMKTPANPVQSHTPWYVTGSGSILACLLLILVPRRRRWAGLLAIVLSVGVLSGVGCGSSSSTSGSGANGQVNTPSGTYTLQLTATGTPASGNAISHSATITVIVQ